VEIMIFTSSPNTDGLTASCGKEARAGIEHRGAEVRMINLNEKNIRHCRACDRGWGICRSENRCVIVDDEFNKIHDSMADMDGFILITPVYFWGMSESAKAFYDRLRRCEAFNTNSRVAAKPFSCIAAAGGTGNGCIPCLVEMEKLVDHLKGDKFDFIHVIQKNKKFKLETIRHSAEAMVDYIKS